MIRTVVACCCIVIAADAVFAFASVRTGSATWWAGWPPIVLIVAIGFVVRRSHGLRTALASVFAAACASATLGYVLIVAIHPPGIPWVYRTPRLDPDVGWIIAGETLTAMIGVGLGSIPWRRSSRARGTRGAA